LSHATPQRAESEGQKQDKSQKHCLAQGRRDAEKGKGKRKRHISRKDGKQNNKGQKQCLTQSPQRAQRNAKAKTLSPAELAGDAEKGKNKRTCLTQRRSARNEKTKKMIPHRVQIQAKGVQPQTHRTVDRPDAGATFRQNE
jgi:hypothetical protein